MPGRRPLVDVPFAREMSLTSIISDIAKVPFFPPKIQVQYFLKFFRTKGDYKSKFFVSNDSNTQKGDRQDQV